jgi:nucleotide-binding universal stress UspA family protein
VGSVVVGFIDTPEGHAAVVAGTEEATRRGARLVVLHSMVGGDRERTEDYIASSDALDRVREQLETTGIDHEIHEYVQGNRPAEDLIHAAEQFDADLIVIGIRKRSATGKAILGSNALAIMHDAPVPVLCVKAE